MALLKVENVSKQFPGVQALSSVSLEVDTGRIHALMGENGAGKSTLVKIISGAQPPDSGRIIFNDHVFEEYSPAYATAHGISVVYQRQQLVPMLSVAENILLGEQPRRFRLLIDRSETYRIAAELLHRLRVDIDLKEKVADLTPAQQQEIAIAKALYRQAKLIILDEPTAALGPSQIERLFELIRDFCSHGISVLYISHHLEEIFRLADDITVLRDGRLVTTQTTSELKPATVVNLMAGHDPHHVSKPLQVPTAMADMAGSSPRSVPVKSALLEIRRLTAGPVLNDVDFVVPKGQVVALTGILGSGTHDLARVLFGLLQPSKGEILLNGTPYNARGSREAIAQGVFLVPENPARDGVVAQMPIAQNITLVDLPAITRFGVLQLKGEAETARKYVSMLRIAASSILREVGKLSGGNQQKVLLAKALQSKAKFLILEEPTQGVDVNAKEEIHRIVQELAATGKAVLVISTDIRDLLLFTDRMVVLREGRIVADLPSNAANYNQVLNLTLGAESGLIT
ncbi:MAG: sugar ABC transporter ATP-binding protein [Verrucomicrobia bacterium]|nr:sugar ABC transporter ATP-binding protein [Verrucomicrobiota bacterium]